MDSWLTPGCSKPGKVKELTAAMTVGQGGQAVDSGQFSVSKRPETLDNSLFCHTDVFKHIHVTNQALQS